MAWVKLDDAMPHHPKVMAAGPQAFALDVAGICYSNKHATDGFIPKASLAAVCPSLSNPNRWAAVLVDVGRWHEVDGGWRVHDIDDFQPTAAEQKEVSKKRAAAGRKGGLRSGEARGKQNASDPPATGNQVASTETNPDPTRPDPTALSASNGFTAFNAKRAVEVVDKRIRDGLTVKSRTGLAKTVAADADHVAESERIWAHRDCEACGGEGFTSEYSPGAGMRRIECAAAVVESGRNRQ